MHRKHNHHRQHPQDQQHHQHHHQQHQQQQQHAHRPHDVVLDPSGGRASFPVPPSPREMYSPQVGYGPATPNGHQVGLVRVVGTGRGVESWV